MPIDPEEAVKAVEDDELSRAVAEKTEEIKSSGDKNIPEFEAVRRKNGEGHRERLKQRFMRSGLKGLAPHEILELMLFYALPRRDTKPVAYELLNRFGSVAGVLNADPEELTKVDFVTENAAVLFKLVPQLVEVYYAETDKDVPCMNTSMLAEMFKPHFVGARSEKFMLACFDAELRAISVTEISSGASSYTSIEMRKILQAVLKSECVMAAIAHNHPGSSPKPSDEDISATRRINAMLKEINVQLMDHIIVGGSRTYSMREGGDLGIFD